MNLIFTQNFPVRPDTFGTTIVNRTDQICIKDLLPTFYGILQSAPHHLKLLFAAL